MAKGIKETDLYAPIKHLLEGQGYVVKGEVGAADLVACREDEDPVIVELKTGFTLSLFHQAIERQAVSDAVYVAVPRGSGRPFQKSLANNLALARRLGIGVMTVRLKDGHVELHVDPAPYRPRKSKRKSGRLLKEFARRVGDPNTGGATRRGLITAYRQDALRCAHVLRQQGPTKASDIAKATGVDKARRLMADDHYGWFERAAVGIYRLTPNGERALDDYADTVAQLAAPESAAAPVKKKRRSTKSKALAEAA